jgi:hypothetical protein
MIFYSVPLSFLPMSGRNGARAEKITPHTPVISGFVKDPRWIYRAALWNDTRGGVIPNGVKREESLCFVEFNGFITGILRHGAEDPERNRRVPRNDM